MNPNWQHSAVAVRRVHLFFSVLVLVTMVRQFFLGNFEGILMCLLTLGLFAVPTLIRRHTQIDLPILLEVLVLLFIFAAEILGEIHNFYGTFPYWDVMLHVINGFLAAAIGLSLVEILNQKDLFHSELSPLLLVLLAFTFSMTIGVLWEFFEFTMDRWFNLDMQKDVVVHTLRSVLLNPTGANRPVTLHHITGMTVTAGGKVVRLPVHGYLDLGLVDTMKDLMVNFIGAVVFSIFGWLYLHNRYKWRFAGQFIPRRR
ncbi:hypothetical protein [Lacticaseibacillus thailandensis]|uniref:hypothetical protein n=2 Tax=Lacticaseibacillus thailandensis TaxID=381741 RepID=UPI0007053FD2|nr:hypothetical protein [Lacticaseibacillus thailandensis]